MGILLVVVLVGCTGCDWTQFGFLAGNTRSTPDTGLTQTGMATVGPAFTGVTGGPVYSSPAVVNGVAYVTSGDGYLYAFSAKGGTGCSNSPASCPPLWTAPLAAVNAPGLSPAALVVTVLMSSPAVSSGEVLVGANNGYLEAFDANGSRNCSGPPTVCIPLWTGQTGGAIVSSPLVVAGVVYVGSADGKLYAFDQAGVINCTAGACAPLWTGQTGGAIDDSPAEVGSTIYVGSGDGKLDSFSLSGTTGCSGTPKVCVPLWTGTTGAPITYSSPLVGSSGVYVGATDGKVYAFDPAGVAGCSGTPVSCAPLWTAVTGGPIQGSPALNNNVLYIGSSDGKLYALDAAGSAGCSGTPKVCTPLWTATTGGVIRSSPAVADNMVFVGSDDHHLYVYDAAGTNGCSGAPKVCAPLWSATTGAEVDSSPVVANAEVYVGSRDHDLYAFKTWAYSRLNCTSTSWGFGPCDLQDAYELPSVVAGAGRTVAIVDAYDDPSAEADLAVYRSTYGLPACTTGNGCFAKLNQTGATSPLPTPDDGWAEETSEDLDMVSAVCPLCHITLVESSNATDPNLVAAEHAASTLSPVAISDSWGGGESSSDVNTASQYTFPGIMTVVAAGDSGYGPSFPATLPGVVAVGATSLTRSTANPRGWTERAWSDTGSGCSPYEPKPAWQTDSGCTKRTVNDVAAVGDPDTGVAVYDTYGPSDNGWAQFGGSSASAPIIAGIYALAYPDVPMSTTYASAASLFDVTTGSNGTCTTHYLCTGGPGYDGPTGMGTPCGTAAFGAAPFAAPCASTNTPSSSIATGPSSPSTTGVGVTPACGEAPPGQMRCYALKVTRNGSS